jgi:hypothetical protein
MFFSKEPIILLLCGYKVTKNPGRISLLMHLPVKRYNSLRVASGFSHEYSIGIRKTGPRLEVVSLTYLLRRNMHARTQAAKRYFADVKILQEKSALRPN